MITRIGVDCNKIIKVSKIVGKNLRTMSEEMGHTRSFLGNMIRDSGGEKAIMSMSDYILFKNLYLEDIAYIENDSAKSFRENEDDKTAKNELYKLIYTAVYQAVKQAWEDAPEPDLELEQIAKQEGK